MNNQNPGALLDNRPQELKDKDFKSSNPELASASAVIWLEKAPEKWKNYPARDQDGSSSCISQGISKALYTLNLNIVSAHPIYRMRSNFPGVGMYMYNAGDILKHQGTVLEEVDPSQRLNEADMNKDLSEFTKTVLNTKPIKIGSYVYVDNFKSIEDIADAVAKHGHCIITVGSNYAEWSSIPVVQGTVNWYHCVCVIDFVLYNGKKYLVIEDSWGSNIGQFDDRRLLSEEFIKTRCTGAMYITLPIPPSPFHYEFTHTLKKGDSNADVNALQKALKLFGFFPQINPTFLYGPVTEAAVNKFQLAYKDEILTPSGLTKPTGIFGPNSIKKMNDLLKQ